LAHEIKSVELPTGVTLQYAEQGDPAGIPVLLLHGYSDSWHSYGRVLLHLPEDIRTFALTLRGHGDSSRRRWATLSGIMRRTWRHSWMLSYWKPLLL
jgi:non-heme chloroperoxidase